MPIGGTLTRRVAAIAATAAVLVALSGGAAVAQTDPYGGGGGTTTSSTTTSATTTTRPASDRVALTTPARLNPGDSTTFTSPAVFEPGSTVDIVLVRGQQGSSGSQIGVDVVVDANGSVTFNFTVPAGTDPGVYFVYAEGVDPDGNPIRVVAALVVVPEQAAAAKSDAPPAAATADPAPSDTATAAVPVPVPADVQRLQLSSDAEQQVLDQLAADDGATVAFDGQSVSVTHDATESSAPMTAGIAAAGLVAAGAIALRTRRRKA